MNVRLHAAAWREVCLIAQDLGTTVRPDYSGRSMYGRRCLALVTDDGLGTLVRFVQAVEREADVGETLDELGDVLDQVRGDQLGLGFVYYWPGVQVVEPHEEERS